MPKGRARGFLPTRAMTEFKIENGVLIKYLGSEASVRVPDGVRAIGYDAFYRCVSLKEIVLPDGLECVLDWAFAGCAKLERIAFPSGVKRIGKGAFLGCGALREAAFSEGLEEIGTGAFKFCKTLPRVYLPRTLRSLGASAFAGCDNLPCLYLPVGVEFVGKEALAGGKFKTIFSEVREKPKGWDEDFDVCLDDGWDVLRCCTVWGYYERDGEIIYNPKKSEQ